MHWFVYAIILISGGVGIHLFSKLSRDLIHPSYAIFISSGVYFIAASIYFFSTGGREYIMETSGKGLLIASLAGVCVAAANMALFYMYKSGAPISVALPATRMVTIVLAVIIGIFFFAEKLSLLKLLGIACSIVAITLFMI